MSTSNDANVFENNADIDIEKIQETVNQLIDHKRILRFLLVGRTGVGKSSTINSLFGEEVALVGKFEPQTMGVEEYFHEHNDVKYRIIDTPGLCDDLESEGNDAKYLDEIKKHIDDIDCVWFVTELDAPRVTSDEKRGIKIISEELGIKIWSRSIIILTRADKVEIAEYKLYFERRSALVRKEIEKYAPDYAEAIPAVAVTNKRDVLPNGKQWLGELFTQVYVRFSDSGALLFLDSMKNEVGQSQKKTQSIYTNNGNTRSGQHNEEIVKNGVKNNETSKYLSSPQQSNTVPGDNKTQESVNGKSEQYIPPQKPRITLDEEQQEVIKQSTIKRVLSGAAAGAATGVKLGSKFGPIGAAVGGVVGATIGGVVGWLFK